MDFKLKYLSLVSWRNKFYILLDWNYQYYPECHKGWFCVWMVLKNNLYLCLFWLSPCRDWQDNICELPLPYSHWGIFFYEESSIYIFLQLMSFTKWFIYKITRENETASLRSSETEHTLFSVIILWMLWESNFPCEGVSWVCH